MCCELPGQLPFILSTLSWKTKSTTLSPQKPLDTCSAHKLPLQIHLIQFALLTSIPEAFYLSDICTQSHNNWNLVNTSPSRSHNIHFSTSATRRSGTCQMKTYNMTKVAKNQVWTCFFVLWSNTCNVQPGIAVNQNCIHCKCKDRNHKFWLQMQMESHIQVSWNESFYAADKTKQIGSGCAQINRTLQNSSSLQTAASGILRRGFMVSCFGLPGHITHTFIEK